MRREATGTYDVTVAGGETVRAFIPVPLPPSPDLDLREGLRRPFEAAVAALGRLDAVTELLPDAAFFVYGYVRKEAVLSSQIEGTQSSLADLMLHEAGGASGVLLDDVVETSNYVAALYHGIRRLRDDGFPLSNRLMREVHAKLFASGRGARRNDDAWRVPAVAELDRGLASRQRGVRSAAAESRGRVHGRA